MGPKIRSTSVLPKYTNYNGGGLLGIIFFISFRDIELS